MTIEPVDCSRLREALTLADKYEDGWLGEDPAVYPKAKAAQKFKEHVNKMNAIELALLAAMSEEGIGDSQPGIWAKYGIEELQEDFKDQRNYDVVGLILDCMNDLDIPAFFPEFFYVLLEITENDGCLGKIFTFLRQQNKQLDLLDKEKIAEALKNRENQDLQKGPYPMLQQSALLHLEPPTFNSDAEVPQQPAGMDSRKANNTWQQPATMDSRKAERIKNLKDNIWGTLSNIKAKQEKSLWYRHNRTLKVVLSAPFLGLPLLGLWLFRSIQARSFTGGWHLAWGPGKLAKVTLTINDGRHKGAYHDWRGGKKVGDSSKKTPSLNPFDKKEWDYSDEEHVSQYCYMLEKKAGVFTLFKKEKEKEKEKGKEEGDSLLPLSTVKGKTPQEVEAILATQEKLKNQA